MKFIDYLKKCLENPEFRKYWEEDTETTENFTLHSILKYLNEENLDAIITDKGITPNDNISAKIEFYENSNKCPVFEYLNSINNQKLKTKTLKSINQLSKEGLNAREPLSKYIADGIFELRTKFASDITRIFYFFVFGNKIILTNGYTKKTDKMDSMQFKLAKKYRDDYLLKETTKT